MSSQVWKVVGGGDKGGILIREGQDLKSPQTAERLSTGALVKELELIGERLHYELIEGTGPQTGWASIKLKDKELLEKHADPAAYLSLSDEELKAKFEALLIKDEKKQQEQLSTWCMKYTVMKFPLPDCKFRVFCFHNAGSAESAFTGPAMNPFVNWIKETKCVELVAVSYPGRDKLIKQKKHTSTWALVEEMLPVLWHKLTDGVPFGFFGHSVGTWVTFELLVLMRRLGLPMPKFALLNAFPGPQLEESKRPWRVNKTLPDEEIKAELVFWDKGHFGEGCRGRMIFDEPEWSATYLPMMRADFCLYDEYKFLHEGAPKFDFPIFAFHSELEHYNKPEMLQLWDAWTDKFTFDTIPGVGHLTCFYINDHKKVYMQKCVDVIKEQAAPFIG